jgi:uncharacterized protein
MGNLEFGPIQIERQMEYLNRLSFCDEITSDYSFVNLWAWTAEYGLSWAWTDDLVWIRQTLPEEVFWAPVGPWQSQDWSRICQKYFSISTRFIRLPEELLAIWKERIPERINIQESRGQWDYLYDIQDLITLQGNRFHKKKNLLNQFKKKHSHRFLPFKEALIGQVLGMQGAWCVWRDCEADNTLSQENRAIQRVLQQWAKLKGLEGGVLLVDEKVVAYTIGERLNLDMLVIHFEKGDPDYKGVYQAINQMFLKSLDDNPDYRTIKRVNREQDLDNEGLRDAKLSYHPIGFLKKYQVTIG